jgi:hypothetical protein
MKLLGSLFHDTGRWTSAGEQNSPYCRTPGVPWIVVSITRSRVRDLMRLNLNLPNPSGRTRPLTEMSTGNIKKYNVSGE